MKWISAAIRDLEREVAKAASSVRDLVQDGEILYSAGLFVLVLHSGLMGSTSFRLRMEERRDGLFVIRSLRIV